MLNATKSYTNFSESSLGLNQWCLMNGGQPCYWQKIEWWACAPRSRLSPPCYGQNSSSVSTCKLCPQKRSQPERGRWLTCWFPSPSWLLLLVWRLTTSRNLVSFKKNLLVCPKRLLSTGGDLSTTYVYLSYLGGYHTLWHLDIVICRFIFVASICCDTWILWQC